MNTGRATGHIRVMTDTPQEPPDETGSPTSEPFADPDPEATRARIHAKRSYRTWTDPDGTGHLHLSGPSDVIARVDNAVRHATTTVDVTLTTHAGQAALDVTDDGPGIPPHHHTTVFDRFTRLDHARTRDTGGSGLGLPIARDIAQAHDGTLRVVATATGARLRAVLPLLSDPAHT